MRRAFGRGCRRWTSRSELRTGCLERCGAKCRFAPSRATHEPAPARCRGGPPAIGLRAGRSRRRRPKWPGKQQDQEDQSPVAHRETPPYRDILTSCSFSGAGKDPRHPTDTLTQLMGPRKSQPKAVRLWHRDQRIPLQGGTRVATLPSDWVSRRGGFCLDFVFTSPMPRPLRGHDANAPELH